MKTTLFSRLAARFILFLAVVLVAGAVSAADLSTSNLNRELGVPITRLVSTDGSIALRIQYVGANSTGSAWAYANAGGDLLFLNDAGSADTTVSTDGTIDVSGASENTFGEVCDAINASANWSCVLVDVLPSWSANNTLTSGTIVQSTSVFDPEGEAITYNTADLDKVSAEIGISHTVNDELTVSGDQLLNRRTTTLGSVSYPVYQVECYLTSATATYTSGAPDLEIYAVKDDAAGATELLLWSQTGAASTGSSAISLANLPAIRAPNGWKLICVYNDTSTPDLTAGSIEVHGLAYTR